MQEEGFIPSKKLEDRMNSIIDGNTLKEPKKSQPKTPKPVENRSTAAEIKSPEDILAMAKSNEVNANQLFSAFGRSYEKAIDGPEIKEAFAKVAVELLTSIGLRDDLIEALQKQSRHQRTRREGTRLRNLVRTLNLDQLEQVRENLTGRKSAMAALAFDKSYIQAKLGSFSTIEEALDMFRQSPDLAMFCNHADLSAIVTKDQSAKDKMVSFAANEVVSDGEATPYLDRLVFKSLICSGDTETAVKFKETIGEERFAKVNLAYQLTSLEEARALLPHFAQDQLHHPYNYMMGNTLASGDHEKAKALAEEMVAKCKSFSAFRKTSLEWVAKNLPELKDESNMSALQACGNLVNTTTTAPAANN